MTGLCSSKMPSHKLKKRGGWRRRNKAEQPHLIKGNKRSGQLNVTYKPQLERRARLLQGVISHGLQFHFRPVSYLGPEADDPPRPAGQRRCEPELGLHARACAVHTFGTEARIFSAPAPVARRVSGHLPIGSLRSVVPGSLSYHGLLLLLLQGASFINRTSSWARMHRREPGMWGWAPFQVSGLPWGLGTCPPPP